MTRSVAIVTGASSGIGRATAVRLARDFGAVVIAARSGEKLQEASSARPASAASAKPEKSPISSRSRSRRPRAG
ncbi:NAD(P)-dependent dehydrogenase (short-subunit alcohol dehydrogenase family) [Bradyrhizobium sp. F1.4.3]